MADEYEDCKHCGGALIKGSAPPLNPDKTPHFPTCQGQKPKEAPKAPPTTLDTEFKTPDAPKKAPPKKKPVPIEAPKPTEMVKVEKIEAAPLSFIPRFDAQAMQVSIDNYKMMADVLKNNMTYGHHYGKFTGWNKDALLEPGASLIMNGFKLFSDPIRMDRVEADDGHYRMHVTVALRPIGSDIVVATGVGSASTKEIKYAYRWVLAKEIPAGTDKEGLLTKEYNGVTKYRIENQDLGDLENTILKMATKRAEIDAVNHLPGVSELFATPKN